MGRAKNKELLDKAGIKYWNSLEVMILHLSYFFRHYANEFVGIQEVKSMLEFMEKSFPGPDQRGHPLDSSAKDDRYLQTPDPGAGFHQRPAHDLGIPQRMGADRKRYRSADRICALLA